MKRKVVKQVTGYKTKDGAGVSLVRVLGSETIKEFDPILMLDSFDSFNPEDYIAGFPMHPHRGIETISYVYSGYMTHKDSLNNQDTIGNGEVQWMTAGSGILHEEKLPASNRMLGVQLWLNLPAKDKLVPPAYHSIKNDSIEEIIYEWGKIRLLAGDIEDKKGYQSKYLPLNYYDIHVNSNQEFELKTNKEHTVMMFTLLGEAYISGVFVREKTAVKLSGGDTIDIKTADKPAQILFVSSTPLKEPVAWGGPIVMNTREELMKAFEDLRRGTFLQDKITY